MGDHRIKSLKEQNLVWKYSIRAKLHNENFKKNTTNDILKKKNADALYGILGPPPDPGKTLNDLIVSSESMNIEEYDKGNNNFGKQCRSKKGNIIHNRSNSLPHYYQYRNVKHEYRDENMEFYNNHDKNTAINPSFAFPDKSSSQEYYDFFSLPNDNNNNRNNYQPKQHGDIEDKVNFVAANFLREAGAPIFSEDVNENLEMEEFLRLWEEEQVV